MHAPSSIFRLVLPTFLIFHIKAHGLEWKPLVTNDMHKTDSGQEELKDSRIAGVNDTYIVYLEIITIDV